MTRETERERGRMRKLTASQNSEEQLLFTTTAFRGSMPVSAPQGRFAFRHERAETSCKSKHVFQGLAGRENDYFAGALSL